MAHGDTETAREQLSRVLRVRREEVVEAATIAMARSRLRHDAEPSRTEVRSRLENVYARVVDAVERREVGSICAYARRLADERYGMGYDLGEVQTALNTLEEELWQTILRDLPPAGHAEALGLVSSVLGAAKDALAREYVALAARHRAPSLDVARLFEGVER